MRKIYCDCCGIPVRDTERLFSLEIKRGQDKEIAFEDMCEDCYSNIMHVIHNAQIWMLDKKVGGCM